jgi:hypothetical protein
MFGNSVQCDLSVYYCLFKVFWMVSSVASFFDLFSFSTAGEKAM